MQLSKQKLFEEHSTHGVSLTHFVQTEADTHLLLQAVVWACSFVRYIQTCAAFTPWPVQYTSTLMSAVNWTDLVQYRNRWLGFVNTVMNHSVP